MFEHLDDPNPVAAGPDQRTAVREEIGRHRRRRVQRAAAATAVAVLLVAVGGLWAFASHDESSVVDTTQTDPSWPSFCAAAARIRDDQQHVETTGGTVVVPGLDADYASLTEAAPDPTLRQALLDAQPMLLGPIRATYPPIQLHASRTVQEALMAQCDTSTAIFGRVVTRLDVTLPPFQRDHPLDDPGALLIGLTAGEATRAAEGTGWTLRVMMIDGVGQIGIADREPNRLDLTVEDGIITAVGTEF